MTDRELIERLLFLAETAEDYFIYCELRELAAALEAQPEPQGPMPEVDDILRLAAIIRRVDGNHDKGAAALAEAILSHPDSRWQHAKPEPQGPTEMEIIAFWSEHCAGDGDAGILRLARWGRPAIEPVPGVEGEP
jgi:hypothetical protein